MDPHSQKSRRSKSKGKGGGRPQAEASLSTPTGAAVAKPITRTPEDQDGALLVSALAIVILVLAVFLQCRNFGFLNFDDNQYIQEIPAVINGLKWESIQWAWTHSHVGQWHPLTSMSFMLDSELGALKTGGGFHLQNVFLQALASVLLLFALHSFTGSVWRSAIATLLFAIHPLRAESVAWITERKDVLSGVFLMATLWAYSFYTRRPVQKGHYFWVCACFTVGLAMTIAMKMGHAPHILIMALPWVIGLPLAFLHLGSRYGLVVLLFALGLLSKPMLVTLPFVFLLLDVWPLKRFSWDKIPASSQEWVELFHTLRPFVSEKLPLLIMAFASAVGAIIAVGEPFRPIPILPLIPRLEYVPVSYVKYIWQFIYPFNLSAHYPFVVAGPGIAKVLICSAILIALTVLAWIGRKKYPYFLVGWLWFLGTMLPVIGIVPGGIQIICDRYTYLTQIGLAVAVVWAVAYWIESGRLKIDKTVIGVVTGLLIVGMAVAAHNQANVWKDDKSLWTHSLAVTKENDYASEKLATTLQAEKNLTEAEALYREALRLNPRLVGSLNNLSIILRTKGQFDEAAELQQRAVNEHPKWGLMHRNLGSALIQQRKPLEAKAAFENALRIEPNDLDAAYQRGIVLSEFLGGKENMEAAAVQFQEILQKQPAHSEAAFSLGNAYYRLGQMDQAAAAYQRTLALNPNHSRAANNLGSIYSSRKQLPDAMALYKRAIAADPGYIEPARNLAECLVQTRAYAEAVQVWKDALTRSPDDLQSIFRLAWILATCPDPSVRRGFESRDLALKGIQLSGEKEPALFDTLAAAYAQLGNFKEAEAAETKAIERNQNNPQALDSMKKRLELFQAGKAYVEPLPQ